MVVMCVATLLVEKAKGEGYLGGTIKTASPVTAKVDNVYNSIDFGSSTPVNREVFARAYKGFMNLQHAGKLHAERNIISICDFSLSANEKRLWVIDLDQKKLLFHSLVAHGQGSGEEFTTHFSNKENSHQSSMGFYVTAGTYNGDNGYSLKLLGQDRGYNDAAYDRAIVMHGADYVSETFIQGNKRLGRSWGCPAVPRQLAAPIIDAIKNKTCLYIYYPDKKYLASSVWLNRQPSFSDEELIKAEYLEMRHKQLEQMATAISDSAVKEEKAAELQSPALPQYMGVKLAVGTL